MNPAPTDINRYHASVAKSTTIHLRDSKYTGLTYFLALEETK